MKLSAEDQNKLAELIDQYGEDNLAVYAPPELGLVVLAPPAPPEGEAQHPFWRLYGGMRAPGSDKAQLMGAFALECVIWPDRSKVAQYLGRKPAAAIVWARRARGLCGESIDFGSPLSESEAAEVERLREKHGKVAWIHVDSVGLVVLAAPDNPTIYRQFFNDCSENLDKTAPQDIFPQFALDCVVHPARDRLEGVFRRLPALAVTMALQGQELCGGELEEVGKASSLLTKAST